MFKTYSYDHEMNLSSYFTPLSTLSPRNILEYRSYIRRISSSIPRRTAAPAAARRRFPHADFTPHRSDGPTVPTAPVVPRFPLFPPRGRFGSAVRQLQL